MQHKLENYILANRDAFDEAGPGDKVWAALEKQFVPGNEIVRKQKLEHFVQDNLEAFNDAEPPARIWNNIEKQFVHGDEAEAAGHTLESFIKANRQAFDDAEPSPGVWQNIEQQFAPAAKTVAITRSLFVRISAAAAVLILVAAGVWMLQKKDAPADTNAVARTAPAAVAPDTAARIAPAPQLQDKLVATNDAKPGKQLKEATTASVDDNSTSEELFYYAKLTEIKFKQLKKIETEEPVLYKSFYSEIKKLDSTHHSLQALLATNADKEAVLSAMLTNLKIETEVLNKQLGIIKTIKQSKKKQYENLSKSV